MIASPSRVVLWLAIKRSDGASRTLYTRTWNTVHLPPDNAQVMLWAETDDVVGCRWDVHHTWWEHDGTPQVVLFDMVVDPTPETLDRIRRTSAHALPYYSSGTPQLESLLTAAGWNEWSPR